MTVTTRPPSDPLSVLAVASSGEAAEIGVAPVIVNDVSAPAVGVLSATAPVKASTVELVVAVERPPVPVITPAPIGTTSVFASSFVTVAAIVSCDAVSVLDSPTYARVVCLIVATASKTRMATPPSAPPVPDVSVVEVEVASMSTVPPVWVSAAGPVGVPPARVRPSASAVREIVSVAPPPAPAPAPKPTLVTFELAKWVPSALTWKAAAVIVVVPPLTNARVAPEMVALPSETATPMTDATAVPSLVTVAVRFEEPWTYTLCPAAVSDEPLTYACVVLSRVAEAAAPAIASPTSATERAIATAVVVGDCVAVASTVMSPSDAVTVAEETNAVTVLSMSFEITEMPVEIPANPAATATPTTVATMVEVSSALTVTAVPAAIVPPVTEASTWTVVVFVPTAAAAAPLTEKFGEIETARLTAAAAGAETTCDVSVVFTSTWPASAVTSAVWVAARTVFLSALSASANEIANDAVGPRLTETGTEAAVAF